MKVKEIMTTDVLTVKPTDNVLEVLKLLFARRISGLPVVDDQGKLVGAVTEKNILFHLLPSYLGKVGRFVYEENPKSTKKKFAELASLSVESLMFRTVVTTSEEVTLCEVARVMITQDARRIPVLDDQNKRLVGIVSRCDVLKALAKEADLDIAGGC